MKKKVTLFETYLRESDSTKDQVNKELGSFKSLLHGEPKDNAPKNDIDKELDNAKWELTEDIGEASTYDIFENDQLIGQADSLKSAMQQVRGLPTDDLEVKKGGRLIGHIDSTGNFVHAIEEGQGFGVEPEDPFASAMSNHEDKIESNKFNTKPEDAFGDAFNSSVKEAAVIGIDEMDPMDELEHVSLVIHPDDGTEPGMDPLMTPMGGCDSEDASVSTFAAPGGPDFEKSGMDNADVLFDGGRMNNEAAHTFSPDDIGFDDHIGGPGLYDEEETEDSLEFNDEENDDWLSYLVEPELEKHNTPSNDMKGAGGLSPTTPTTPLKKENGNACYMENVKRLKNQLSEARKTVVAPNQIAENIKRLKTSIKNIKK